MEMHRRVQALKLEQKVPEIIKDTSGTLISLNQKQLFNRGVNVEGEVIGRYSFLTQVISKGKKKQGAHYTLFDTGGFYRGMFIEVQKDKIIFDSKDYKSQMLQDVLGNNIFGLTKESRQQYIYGPGLFFSKVKSYIESTLKLKFTR